MDAWWARDSGLDLARLMIIIQLFIGSYIVFLMDEVVSKWGIGSGISLFIAAGVAQAIFTGTLNWQPGRHDQSGQPDQSPGRHDPQDAVHHQPDVGVRHDDRWLRADTAAKSQSYDRPDRDDRHLHVRGLRGVGTDRATAGRTGRPRGERSLSDQAALRVEHPGHLDGRRAGQRQHVRAAVVYQRGSARPASASAVSGGWATFTPDSGSYPTGRPGMVPDDTERVWAIGYCHCFHPTGTAAWCIGHDQCSSSSASWCILA